MRVEKFIYKYWGYGGICFYFDLGINCVEVNNYSETDSIIYLIIF